MVVLLWSLYQKRSPMSGDGRDDLWYSGSIPVSPAFLLLFSTLKGKKMKRYLVSNIGWDTDGQEVDLPESIGVIIEDDYVGFDAECISDEIIDQVSDNLEFCVHGCSIEELDEGELPPVDFVFTLV